MPLRAVERGRGQGLAVSRLPFAVDRWLLAIDGPA